MTAAGETSRKGMGNTRVRRTNTAKRAPNMLTHHRHVRVHVCTVSILWGIQFNPDQSSQTTSSNNNVTAPLNTSRNDKLRVAWEGLGNTRAGRANTADRAPTMLTHHHVRVHVCTVSIQWEIHTDPYQFSETTT